jgi:TrmH family RNA methyltransferase
VNCFVSDAFRGSTSFGAIGSKLSAAQIESFVISESLLNSISDTKTQQGIILIAKRPGPHSLGEIFSPGDSSRLPVWIYLYEVNNPSNLGAVIRTVEAASARAVIVSSNSTDPLSPKSLRASMGSAFRLPVVNDAVTEEVVSMVRTKGIAIAAVHAAGSMSYSNVDWRTPRLLLFGSEAQGLPAEVLSLADETIKIPMHIGVESLNLAVSAGIVLFEAKRQMGSRE